MRILIVHPGAAWSTADVHYGVTGALERAGVEVVQYPLDGHINIAGEYLSTAWRAKHKDDADYPTPTQGDVLYWASQGALERALRFEADWALVISAMYFHPDVMVLLRRAGIKVALLYTESPYDDGDQVRFAQCANVVWVNDRDSVRKFAGTCPAFYWQHALDTERHRAQATERDAEVASHDVVFVGTGFQERIDILRAVNWDGIDLGLYGEWGLLGSRNRLRQHVKGGVVRNAATAALYRQAKIGLNIHRTSIGFGRDVEHIGHAASMNPRCYELAATETFFVTDYREEVTEVFGDAVPTYRTPGELEEIVRYYLAHDDEREAMAARLPELVVGHTFDARVADLLQTLERLDLQREQGAI